MSFTAHRCVSISCDGCGKPLPMFKDAGRAHFTSQAEAAAAAYEVGWQIQHGRQECEPCSDLRRGGQGHQPATKLAIADDGSFEVQELSWCVCCHASLDGEPELEARIGGV